jgi:hypothetical protein
MAIRQPGMFLSQPPMATNPSKPWQPTTVSMESAMTSRDTSEYFMPSVPMEMPSEMVMVLNTTALPPDSLMPGRPDRQLVDVHVARRDHAPGGGDADLGLAKISPG